jgi:hypothetical protein
LRLPAEVDNNTICFPLEFCFTCIEDDICNLFDLAAAKNEGFSSGLAGGHEVETMAGGSTTGISTFPVVFTSTNVSSSKKSTQ